MDDELLAEFIEESKTFLDAIESDLLTLESCESLDSECINRIFRAVHTIKGGSSFLQLNNITSLSHRAESLLCQIRDGSAEPSSDNVSVILESVDTLSAMLNEDEVGALHDVDELLARLDAAMGNEADDAAKRSEKHDTKSERSAAEVPANPETAAGDASRITSPPPSKTDPTPPATADVADAVSATGKNPAPQRVNDPSMRVPASVLGHLLHITGEMVMARNQMLSASQQAADPSLARLSRLISEVHETVLKTRKGTTGALFNRFHRVVRDLTLSLGKEAQLIVDGGDLELDRSIIDAFSDPLTHLVRNCVDHALEMPDERLAAGKPRAGTITLRSKLQTGEIVLEIEDDGRGIDPATVKQKAINKGVIDARDAAHMTDQQAIELIFAPGFSTKEEASDLSGRGVGMDVVKTKIEEIGGAVRLESHVGRGTRLTAHLPLAKALVTSSLTRTLIVGVDQNRFAIPDSAVCEIIRPDRDNYPRDFRTLEHGEVFHLRGEILPMIHLADALAAPAFDRELTGVRSQPRSATSRLTATSIPAGGPNQEIPDVALVIIRHRQHRFALVVDDVEGIREAIVQPIPKLLEHSSLYTGHAVMGDGQCIFILDISNIEKRNRLHVEPSAIAPSERRTGPAVEQREQILIFDYGQDQHFAIPLEIASFVNSTEPAQFRHSGNATYYLCQGRMRSLIYLDQYLRVAPAEFGRTPPNIILPANIDVDVAIACGHDLTVATLDHCFKSHLDDDACSIAIFERDDKLITLLDIYRLIERHSPDAHPHANKAEPARILCVDDSVFFRQLLTQYLSHPNWAVQLVTNGREALQTLRDATDPFDIVISDINMPEINGFELAEFIREDPKFADLPLIALTTQVDEQSRLRGLEAGFDHYVAKINKFALCECIQSFIADGRDSMHPEIEMAVRS